MVNRDAAHKLVTSHLRLVVKVAMGYRGYGLPISEVISEGNVGLMQSVKRFEPEKGFRLATYAIWWIKAASEGDRRYGQDGDADGNRRRRHPQHRRQQSSPGRA
jgi:RNA polymerase sigma factor (sigma-70 family)